MPHIDLKSVDTNNHHIYSNLMQCYECEFSAITRKSPDQEGLFALDTKLGGDVLGFIGFVGITPVALAAIKIHDFQKYEFSEFFVVPSFRRRNLGSLFAEAIWSMFPGHWEVKQIDGADYAVSFWRDVLSKFTGNSFIEDVFIDSYWGQVTRQRFEIPGKSGLFHESEKS